MSGTEARPGRSPRQLLWPGVLIGIGVAGTLDEVILHQLLHWHHFYDRATPAVGLVSDGLFHLASTSLLVAGLYLALAVVWRQPGGAGTGRIRELWAGVLVGAGGFNLYDGTIQHKVLRLHQVRPGVDPLPYDVAFVGLAAGLVLIGLALLRSSEGPRSR